MTLLGRFLRANLPQSDGGKLRCVEKVSQSRFITLINWELGISLPGWKHSHMSWMYQYVTGIENVQIRMSFHWKGTSLSSLFTNYLVIEWVIVKFLCGCYHLNNVIVDRAEIFHMNRRKLKLVVLAGLCGPLHGSFATVGLSSPFNSWISAKGISRTVTVGG